MFQRIVCATDFSDTAEAAWGVIDPIEKGWQQSLTRRLVVSAAGPWSRWVRRRRAWSRR